MGRFKPIGVEGWLNEHTIGLNPELSEIHVDDESGAGQLLEGVE
jgi:N-acyl-D-glutamate deacylase